MEDPGPIVAQLPWRFALALSVALLLICVVGWRWHARAPGKSAIAMALWMLLLMSVYWRQESLIQHARVQVFVDEAQRVRSVVGEASLFSLRWNRKETMSEEPDYFWKINEEFRFYYGRIIHRVWRNDFDNWLAQQRGEVFIMLRPLPEHAEKTAFLTARGFTLVDHAQVDTEDRQELWTRPGSRSDPAVGGF
jgi:hypothetical protein